MHAAKCGDLEMVKAVIGAGADPMIVNEVKKNLPLAILPPARASIDITCCVVVDARSID